MLECWRKEVIRLLYLDEKIVDVIEVVGAKNAKPYLEEGWVVLGVVSTYDTTDGAFIYALGKPGIT